VTLRLSRRAWRLVAVSYALKTLLVSAAWILIPDLPQQALALLQAPFSNPRP
jgi:hypothetical protein